MGVSSLIHAPAAITPGKPQWSSERVCTSEKLLPTPGLELGIIQPYWIPTNTELSRPLLWH
jgi:hypothetical protein